MFWEALNDALQQFIKWQVWLALAIYFALLLPLLLVSLEKFSEEGSIGSMLFSGIVSYAWDTILKGGLIGFIIPQLINGGKINIWMGLFVGLATGFAIFFISLLPVVGKITIIPVLMIFLPSLLSTLVTP